MNVFKTFSLTWLQAGFFKLGLLALGVAIGAYWPHVFAGILPVLLAIAAVCLAYVTYVWWKQ
jgi:predicted anti-sigma-YlaC factor YlaD